MIFARSRSAYPQRPLTPLCEEHALTGRGAPHAKKSKDISVFALRFEPSTELKALDCAFVRALVYILHIFFCFAFFLFRFCLYVNFDACKDDFVSLCYSSELLDQVCGFCFTLCGICDSIISCTEQWLLRTAQLLIFVQKLEKMFSPMCFFFLFACKGKQCMH